MTRNLRPHETAYITALRDALNARGAADSVAVFVDYARRLLMQDLPVLFSVEHVAYAVGVPWLELVSIAEAPESHYTAFRVAKRRGGSRVIEAPSTTLKHIQRYIRRYITARVTLPDCVHGFRSGRSIITNARPHIGQQLVVRYDLRDFFGSVERSRVLSFFSRLGYAETVARLLASLCTLRGTLPQGAPTSPDLANIAAIRLDQRLSALAASRGFTYTRYADDLTFSGSAIAAPASRRAVEYIIRDSGFRPNDSKTAYLSQATRQRVTGLVVNARLNWPRDVRRWLRQEVYYLEKYGHASHAHRRGYTQAHYREFVYGHVYALHSVRPDEAIGFLERLDRVDWDYA